MNVRPAKTQNLIILVAGAQGGIGKATCRYLAECGAIVVAASRSAHRRSELAALDIAADLSTDEGWRTVIASTVAAYHRIDVLVNCVGAIVPGPFERLSDEEIDLLLKSNIHSALYALRAILPVLRRQGHGHIVQVGSLGGIIPMPFESLYSASKFATRGLCLSLRHELRGTGVDVSLGSPGPVHTRMLDREAMDDHSTITFAARILNPDDVARAIFKVILSPKGEVILPRSLGPFARLFGSSSRLTSTLLPLLRSRGKAHLRAYRRALLLSRPIVGRTGS